MKQRALIKRINKVRYWRRLILLVAALLVLARRAGYLRLPSYGEAPPSASQTAERLTSVEQAYRDKLSGVEVDAAGKVVRLLSDDNQGSRHQRFIIRVESGQTLLVAHNIDLAPRAPLSVGQAVEVRGEYEWNQQGGVLHWTHADPSGKRPGGWIRTDGRVYR